MTLGRHRFGNLGRPFLGPSFHSPAVVLQSSTACLSACRQPPHTRALAALLTAYSGPRSCSNRLLVPGLNAWRLASGFPNRAWFVSDNQRGLGRSSLGLSIGKDPKDPSGALPRVGLACQLSDWRRVTAKTTIWPIPESHGGAVRPTTGPRASPSPSAYHGRSVASTSGPFGPVAQGAGNGFA